MDWNNIDLDSAYERGLCVLDGYDLETLFTEIGCNIPTKKLNKETVMQQFEDSLKMNIQSAREIMAANIDNIVKHELKNREERKLL